MIYPPENTDNRSKSLLIFMHILIILAILLSFAPAVLGQDAPSITATLSSTHFSITSGTTLSITVNGSRSANVIMPEMENCIVHRRGQSTQVQVINGSYTSSITSNYIIQAQKSGKYTIPAIAVEVEGQILHTKPLSFEVAADSAASGQNQDPAGTHKGVGDAAFIRITGIKDTAYVGEIIPMEIKAFFQNGLRAEIHKLPALKGDSFVMSPLDNEPHQGPETYNGRSYSVLTWQTVLSPIKEGAFDLEIDLNATLLIPQRNSRSRFNDPFFGDDFFGGLFGGYQREAVLLTTPKQSLRILPLPQEGKPENFSGTIGEFDFEVSAAPTSIEVGDPITLIMKISGKGNFDRVTAPLFPTGDNWKTYSPSSHFVSAGNNYEGEKIFEQAIVAKTRQIDSIPPLTFNYFDPKKNQYIAKSSRPVPLTFPTELPAPSPIQQSTPAPKPEIEKQHKTRNLPLAPIRLKPGRFTAAIKPVFTRPWYIVALSCCSLIMLTILYLALRQRYVRQNSTLLEKKRVNRLVVQKLPALQQAINDNNGHNFLQGCRDVIQIQLGLLWQKEPSAITPFDLQKRLPPQSSLIQIFSAAEQYAYGGGRLTTEEMQEYLRLLNKEMEELS